MFQAPSGEGSGPFSGVHRGPEGGLVDPSGRAGAPDNACCPRPSDGRANLAPAPEAGAAAASDASGPWWPSTNSRGCESAGLPSSTDRLSGAGAPELEPIHMRISRIRFGAANDDEGVTPNLNAWKDIGFDLDGMCTGSSTCSPGGTAALEQACKNPTLLPFDGNRCIDNAIGKLFTVAQKSPQVGLLFGVTEQNFNCALHRGELTTLIRITGYDGQPNDPSVRADLYTSVGVDPRWLPSWRCLGPDGKLSSDWFDQAPILPTRHFTVARHSLALNEADGSERADAAKPLPNAKVSDAAAFVRAGWLFVSLPPASEFWLDGERAHIPGFRLELSRSVLVARIGRGPDGTWSLTHGTAAGVVRPHDILQAFRNLGFCENMCLAYRNLIDYLNSERDMLLTATGPLPEVLCDSLSIGFAFEARQAAADSGDIVDVSDPVDCPKPRHPLAPQHGCTCPAPDAGGGACLLP